MSRNRRPSARLEAVGEKNPKGRIVVRHRVVDSLARMRQAGTIDAPMLDAGREFQRSSILAQFDPLQLAVRNRVHRALLALGGHDSPAGSCAWHILGCGQSVREWALRQAGPADPCGRSTLRACWWRHWGCWRRITASARPNGPHRPTPRRAQARELGAGQRRFE